MRVASLLTLVHLIGLALGLGAATAKTILLLRAKSDRSFLPAFLSAGTVLTRLILTGLVLLVLSGAAWLIIGAQPLTPTFVVKLALVAAIFVLGPVIDKRVAPRYRALAPAPGMDASEDFQSVEHRYVTLEITATAIFYLVLALWTLR